MENTKTAWIVFGIVAFFLLFVMPFGGNWGGMGRMMYGYGNYGYYGYGGMMGGFFNFGWVMMLAIIVLISLAIAWLIQQLQQPRRRR